LHPWHDITIDEQSIEVSFPACIEVPMGSQNKYEIDKENGFLKLDRVLYSAVHYPGNYGFIPRTFCDDGDPLDVLVIGCEPVHPLTIVESRAVGVLRMRDDKGIDDKIIAVCVHDPAVSQYTGFAELPKHTTMQLRRFFADYKVLEDKEVIVEDIQGPEKALEILRDALEMYRRLRRGELKR